MSFMTFDQYRDPYGFDAGLGGEPQTKPRPKPVPNFDQFNSQFFARMRQQAAAQKEAVRQYQARHAASMPQPYMGPWAPKPPSRPAAAPVAASQPKPAASPAPMPPRTPASGGQPEAPQARPAQPTQQAQNQRGPDLMQAFNQLRNEHFGQLGNMVGSLNSALSDSANRMSEAAARQREHQHSAAMANQDAQLKMEQIRSQERMAQAELADRKEKRKAIAGMMGMGGFGPFRRSMMS